MCLKANSKEYFSATTKAATTKMHIIDDQLYRMCLKANNKGYFSATTKAATTKVHIIDDQLYRLCLKANSKGYFSATTKAVLTSIYVLLVPSISTVALIALAGGYFISTTVPIFGPNIVFLDLITFRLAALRS